MTIRTSAVRLAALLVVLGGCASAQARHGTAEAADIHAIPKIDVHAHYRTDNPELVAALEAWNARAVLVNVTGSDRKIDEKWRDYLALRAAHPGRFFLVATFDPFHLEEPDGPVCRQFVADRRTGDPAADHQHVVRVRRHTGASTRRNGECICGW